MMRRAGRLPDDRAAILLLNGMSVSFPQAPLPLLLSQVLIAWASKRDMPALAHVARSVAEELHMRLIEEGWCLDDLQSGAVLALPVSDAETLAALAVHAPMGPALVQSRS